MRKLQPMAVLIVLAVLAAAPLPAAETQEGKLTIDKPASVFPAGKLDPGGVKKWPAVTFNHRRHGESYACAECHHAEPSLKAGDKSAKPCFGGDCHGPEAKVTAGGKTMVDAHAMVHDKKDGKCLKCHASDQKAKAAKAPTRCPGCHAGAGK